MMAINFNLSDLSSGQRRAGTARRYNTPYTYPLLSATPSARQAAIDDADAAYKQSVLNQEKAQFDTQLAQNAAQYNTSLAQTARQFNENQAMQQQIAEEQAAQAQTASYIQAGQNALTLAALVGKDNLVAGGKAVADMVLPSTMTGVRGALGIAPKVVEAAAPTAVGAAEATVPLAGAETGNALGTAIGGIGKSSAAAGSAAGGSIGSGIGSAYGSLSGSTTASATGGAVGAGIGSAIGYAAPYYALAKLGGMAINAITANNPDLVETPFGRLGGSLDRPEDVEGYWGREAADHGIGNEEINQTIASGANPLGGLLYNTRDTIGNAVIAPDPVTLGATNVLSGVAKQVLGEETGNQVNSLLSLGTSTLGNIGTSTEATVDAGLNIATGGLWGAVTGGGCVIVTACTDRHAPEVEIAREYRDKYLSPDQLRGYYMIAEKVVPRIERSNRLKKFVKRILVDNLIEYGRFALGKTTKKPGAASRIITKTFLALCEATGRTRKTFTRSNGEVF